MSEHQPPRDDSGLTLDEAIARLEQIASHSRDVKHLAIAYDPGVLTIGPTPWKPIKAIYPGIDFDRKRVFVDVAPRLAAPGGEFEAVKDALRKATDAIGFILLALNNRALTPDAKVAAISATVNRYRDDPVQQAPHRPSAP